MSNILIAVALSLTSLLFYLFFLWKYLREDYDNDQVFSFGFLTYFGLVIGLIVGGLLTHFWYWIAIVGYLIVFVLLFRKSEFKIYELIESSIPGFLFFHAALYFYGTSVFGTKNLASFIGSLVILGLFFFLKKNYKKIPWYKSGRLGFAGLFSLGSLFLSRAIIIVLPGSYFSFTHVAEFIPAAILSFICFFSLYNLSER